MQIRVLKVQIKIVINIFDFGFAVISRTFLNQNFWGPFHHQHVVAIVFGAVFGAGAFCRAARASNDHQVPFAKRIKRDLEDDFVFIPYFVYLCREIFLRHNNTKKLQHETYKHNFDTIISTTQIRYNNTYTSTRYNTTMD